MLCLYCSSQIPQKRVRHHATFCSSDCRKRRDRDLYKKHNPTSGDSKNKGATGAASELLVAADLLRRGYHVFRSVAPDGACDLLILQGKSVLRIEVKTAYRNRDGTIGWPNVVRQEGRHDILAIAVAGDVHYKPESF